jgi:hypothetical protein
MLPLCLCFTTLLTAPFLGAYIPHPPIQITTTSCLVLLCQRSRLTLMIFITIASNTIGDKNNYIISHGALTHPLLCVVVVVHCVCVSENRYHTLARIHRFTAFQYNLDCVPPGVVKVEVVDVVVVANEDLLACCIGWAFGIRMRVALKKRARFGNVCRSVMMSTFWELRICSRFLLSKYTAYSKRVRSVPRDHNVNRGEL